MVENKNQAIIPNNCVVRILQLIGNEKKSNTLSFRLISKHSPFIGNRHRIFSSSNGGVNKILHHMSRLPSEIGNYETAKGIYTNVSSQNISTSFVLQYWMVVLED